MPSWLRGADTVVQRKIGNCDFSFFDFSLSLRYTEVGDVKDSH